MERLSLASWLGMARLPPGELSKPFEPLWFWNHTFWWAIFTLAIGEAFPLEERQLSLVARLWLIQNISLHEYAWSRNKDCPSNSCAWPTYSLSRYIISRPLSLLHELVGRHSCYLPCVVSIWSNKGLSPVILNSQVLNSVQYWQQLDLMGKVYAFPMLDSRRLWRLSETKTVTF